MSNEMTILLEYFQFFWAHLQENFPIVFDSTKASETIDIWSFHVTLGQRSGRGTMQYRQNLTFLLAAHTTFQNVQTLLQYRINLPNSRCGSPFRIYKQKMKNKMLDTHYSE